MGNYGVILSLLGCLEHGVKAKKLVDKVIDVCKSISRVCASPHCDAYGHRRSCGEPTRRDLPEPNTVLPNNCCRRQGEGQLLEQGSEVSGEVVSDRSFLLTPHGYRRFLRIHSFFAIAFANYVETQDDFSLSFAGWLKVILHSIHVFEADDNQSTISRRERKSRSESLNQPVALILCLTTAMPQSGYVLEEGAWIKAERLRPHQ